MRHQCKRHHLSKAADQRRALLRSLATELFLHGEIKTTMAKAKALKPYVEQIISLAKKGDLHSRRQAVKLIFNKKQEKQIILKTSKMLEQTRGIEVNLLKKKW